MQSNLKYRIVALTLAVIFAAFNIGLPIVVASCPMMEMTRGVACCAMNEPAADGVARISNFVDTSCCETKFLAERNKTAFLQEQLKRVEQVKLFVVLLQTDFEQSAIRNPQSAIIPSSSPPRSVDIPILVSSLLI